MKGDSAGFLAPPFVHGCRPRTTWDIMPSGGKDRRDLRKRKMNTLARWRRGCTEAAFAVLALALFAAPWFFGAWEMWWFWPFVAALALAGGLTGTALLVAAFDARHEEPAGPDPTALAADSDASPRRVRLLRWSPGGNSRGSILLWAVPFLVYAWIRMVAAPVRMDAERSFLLFFTAWLIGVGILVGLEERHHRFLSGLLLANFVLIGLYGVVNHTLTGSRLVLWEEGYSQYWMDDRASGPLFCPNHFAGAMTLALSLGLGWAWTPGLGATRRLVGGLASGVALVGVWLSRSRAGGVVALTVLAASLLWGPQGPALRRKRVRWIALATLAAALAGAVLVGRSYFRRFDEFLRPDDVASHRVPSAGMIFRRIRESSRGQMIEGTLRAWRMDPVWGIGPGMHAHIWPHVAASPDGDRERGIWPSYLNNYFHSYEAHSDWLQLLEEYGLIGFALVLIPTVLVMEVLRGRLRFTREHAGDENAAKIRAAQLSGILAIVAMGLYSWVDFNLQIPALTWLTAALVALGLAASSLTRPGTR